MSSQQIAQKIVDRCETNPPQDVDGHPDLFSDLDDKNLHESLFKLWQKGMLVAKWDDGHQETSWALSEFGVELGEKGLAEAYIEATENEIQIDVSPALLEEIEP